MIVVGLLVYLVTGLVAIGGVVTIHFIKAEMKGYDCLNWWDEHNEKLKAEMKADGNYESFIIGLFKWPIKVKWFIDDLPYYYEQYGLK